MIKNLLTVAFAFVSIFAFAQEDATKEVEKSTLIGGEGTLTFSNTGFGEYYSGGGLGSTTIAGLLNAFANKKYDGGANWDNSLRLDYGVAKVENTNGENFIKSSDVVDFISKYGSPVKNSDKWFYSAAFNLLTQLTDTKTAYDQSAGNFTDLIGLTNATTFGKSQSTLFAPADISLGLGMDYKPNDNFSAFIGPLAGKLRVIADDQIAQSGLFGNDITISTVGTVTSVTDYKSTRFEAGANAMANYNRKFLTDDMLSFSTGLKLFSNYLENPQNVDVNWNTVTSLNPWKFVTITYATDLAYDDDKKFTAFANGKPTSYAVEGVQFRNVLGIGLVHKFGDKK